MRSNSFMKNPMVTIVRRVVGIICLIIGILGLLLPILPGWPFIVPAIVLLGRRDRALRFTHLWVRMVLRFMRRHPAPSLRQFGQRLSREYVSFKHMIVPKIDAAERAIGLS
jgi:uncharacterized membrane protein YbaN (DUF454 family)